MSQTSDKLLDAWLAPDGSGAPVACVASTFTFEAGFFDEDCLARFLQLDAAIVTGGDETDTLAYILEREARLENVRASVLVDRSYGQAAATFRWDVIPVAPSGGVQHSKVSLLLWENRLRLIVASANLTRSSYRSNVEVFTLLDDADEEVPTRVFSDAVEFLDQIVTHHTRGKGGDNSPRGRTRASLRQARERLDKRPEPHRRGRSQVAFVHSLHSGTLLDQAFNAAWTDRHRPSNYRALSPFFDRDSTDGLDALADQLRAGRSRRQLVVRAVEAGEGQVKVDAPLHLGPLHDARRLEFLRLPVSDGEVRPLHAKAFIFANGRRIMVISGSPNASSPGLGLTAARNIEAALAVSDVVGSDLGQAIDEVIPELEPLPDGKLVLDAPGELEEDERIPQLPLGFVEALYRPDEDVVEIELHVPKLPARWSIRRGQDIWFEAGNSPGAKLRRQLHGQQAPRSLTVEWDAPGDEGPRIAELIVAVADAAQLPDPPEIQKLTLEELLDLLAVGGRLQALLRRLARRRLHPDPRSPTVPDELDPHQRVDTSDFLLQRTRRMSFALEGLQRKLGDPIANPDALDRRLRGPFGAVGLSDAAARAVKDNLMNERERAFLLAELALVISRVKWKSVGGGVSVPRCRREAKAVLADLRPKPCGDAALDAYVADAFGEAL